MSSKGTCLSKFARKVAKLMPLSTSPTFEMEKLKRQASEVHQKLDEYTYEEVLLAVQSQQDPQRFLCSADDDFP